MRIERKFTTQGQSAYEAIPFRKATSEIRNPDGSVVFKLENIDVPVQSARLQPIFWHRNISAKPVFPHA